MKDRKTKDLIPITDDKILVLQQMSHEFHILYADSMKEYGEREMKLIDDVLNFGYKMIQVIGIVAGFGFTAIGSVKNIYLFVLGQGILLFTIVYGIFKIKQVYTNNLDSIQLSSDRVNKLFLEKSDLFLDVIPKAISEGFIDIVSFQARLNIVDQKLIKEFRPNENGKRGEDFLSKLLILLVLGGIFLLISFIWFSLSRNNFMILNHDIR